MIRRIAIVSTAHVHVASYLAILTATPGVEVRVVETVEELGDWAPDGVIITSENIHHRRHVEAAAAIGAHVLCEKPIATTEEDALAIIDVCRTASVGLMIAFPVRFAPEVERLKDLFEAGELGELVSAIGVNTGRLPSEREWFSDPKMSGGGALVDHIVHIADILDEALGLRATSVNAVSNQILHADRAKSGAETAALVTIEYGDGLVATIDCSWSYPDTAPHWGGLQLEVAGSSGSVWINPFASVLTGIDAAAGRATTIDLGVNLDSRMIDAFLQSIEGQRAFEPSGDVGLRTLRIVLAAQESARSGRSVAL